MNRYKVMLVDDEEDVAQAIMKKLDWENMGFETPRYAHNGLEALDFAAALLPLEFVDVVNPYPTLTSALANEFGFLVISIE